MNIVTIDFDIVMHYSLKMYNDLVDDDNTIQHILNESPQGQFIPHIDLHLYNYLTNFVIKCCKKLKPSSIFFIEDHGEIVDFFTSELINPQENFNIFNIDFHHDIAYNDEDIDNRIKNLDCGNWVKYLFEKHNNRFIQYIWIKTEESTLYENNDSFMKRVIIYDINKYNLDNLLKTADVLFLCRSIPWVPDEAQQLYETWGDIVDNLYKK